MELTITRIVVNRETDFDDNGVEKVLADISIICNLVGENNSREVVISTEVVSLNSDRGTEMDLQRQTACENLINNF